MVVLITVFGFCVVGCLGVIVHELLLEFSEAVAMQL